MLAPSKGASFPRKRESIGAKLDTRLRGGDEGLAFVSIGGPQPKTTSKLVAESSRLRADG
jgi:hypothetical protein